MKGWTPLGSNNNKRLWQHVALDFWDRGSRCVVQIAIVAVSGTSIGGLRGAGKLTVTLWARLALPD